MGYALIVPDVDWSGYENSFQVHPIVKKMPTALKIVGSDTLDNDSNLSKYNVGFTPILASFRTVTWEVIDGTEYASFPNNKIGMLNAKYVAGDTGAHNVTIQATSTANPSVKSTKVVSVKCNVPNGGVTFNLSNGDKPQYNKGISFKLIGYIEDEECALVRFVQPVSRDTFRTVDLTDKISLVDNNDGTATVTILTDEYLHQVEFKAYNVANGKLSESVIVNINDKVIIDSADGANSAGLMAVFNGEGKTSSPTATQMWLSEAYVITEL